MIGWSLGGAMANALALRMPERVRPVVTLGSPLSPHPRANHAWRIFELVSGIRGRRRAPEGTGRRRADACRTRR